MIPRGYSNNPQIQCYGATLPTTCGGFVLSGGVLSVRGQGWSLRRSPSYVEPLS